MEIHNDLFGIENIYGKHNQLHVMNLGMGANMNPWAGNDSASRAQMFTSHLAQVPVIAHPDVRRTLTGTEREYGVYTFKQKIKDDGMFHRIIDKYPLHHFRSNPQKLAIYRSSNHSSAYYGVVDITTYNIRHQYFGFMYKPKGNNLNHIRENEPAVDGMVISQSPSIDDQGNYRMGVSSNIIYMSIHTTIEDGVFARRKWLERFKSTGIESRTAITGDRCYLIDMYGDGVHYRGHPELGGRIASHGIVMAVRDFDPLLAVVEMTPDALRKPDFVFDKLVYGKPGAEVIDISVYHDHNLDRINNEEKTPVGIDAQSKRYYEALLAQQLKIIALYEELKRKHGDKLVLEPNFHRMISWAHAFTNHHSVQQPQGSRVNLTYRRAPVGDFRTELVFKYDIMPSVGSKVTTLHGGKGVVVRIGEDEEMPCWADGTIADLVMDNDSNIKRMNIGGPYEQATNAFSRQLSNQVKKIMSDTSLLAPLRYEEAYKVLQEYYSIASPLMHEFMNRVLTEQQRRVEHVDGVVKNGIYLWLPPNTEDIGSVLIDRLERRYGLEMHHVRIMNTKGEYEWTKQKMLIAETYIIMLEKNGFDWSSVASPKRQHYGILARMTNMDKHSTPGRENAVRSTGEAEIRLLLALLPDYIVADILDRPNNPAAHKAEVRAIISAPNPAQIEMAVDRRKIPLGGNRAIQFIRHVMWCCGIALTRMKSKIGGKR